MTLKWESNGLARQEVAHTPAGWFVIQPHLDHYALKFNIGPERDTHFLLSPDMCKVVAEDKWQRFVDAILEYEGGNLYGGTD